VGFEVDKCINGDRESMRSHIRSFADEITKGGVGLFYYAGHGIQVEGENYLVPVNARILRKYEVEDECLRVSSVMRAMAMANNRLNIIILDACRDNPFRGMRGGYRGLAQMQAPVGSLLAYATAPGSVASDGSGRNGLYTEALLKHMHTPGLRLLDLFIKVRNDVAGLTDNRQIPWENHSLRGRFYFLPDD
jgi:uncharacterized caspase-like protein